ncbi:hypothetical protein U9M48_016197 [Paspalum notatum var. saurae]|uniref:Retrotransposon gag domain-containing protein n=1 Tax=Paspalum notatum var. saurae TaxID=547442 RepID=A0AAQ3T4U5_PASNO
MQQPAGRQVPWTEFKTVFREHYVPEGLVQLKLQKFLSLKQGNMTVMEYVQAFNHLAQFAPDYLDSDPKKRGCFFRGLSPRLQDKMGVTFDSFNALVNEALTRESRLQNYNEDKKRKTQRGSPSLNTS